MTARLAIYQLQQIDAPPAVMDALTDDFIEPLRIENPPAVRLIENLGHIPYGGWCPSGEIAEYREVAIKDFSRPRLPTQTRNAFRLTYVHEAAHYLLQKWPDEKIGGDHGPVFFSLNLLLFLRAGDKEQGFPWWQSMALYDIQDYDFWEKNDKPAHPIGQAIDWAWRMAYWLAETNLTTEKCAETLIKEYKKWLDELNQLPARGGRPPPTRAGNPGRSERDKKRPGNSQ